MLSFFYYVRQVDLILGLLRWGQPRWLNTLSLSTIAIAIAIARLILIRLLRTGILKHGIQTEAMRHLEEQTGITQADCEEYLMDVPISVSSTYGARYFVYKVSECDCSREMKMKIKQNGLEKEWVKFSKADEQASVKPSKWKRWSEARRDRHQERMWGHIQQAGAKQVKVQVGTGTGKTQEVGQIPEGGMDSRCEEQSEAQKSKWRAEDSTATETIFRSLARNR